MAESPERSARADIDRLLAAAGWAVQDYKAADIHAARYALGVPVALFGEGADRFSARAVIRCDLQLSMRAERQPRCC